MEPTRTQVVPTATEDIASKDALYLDVFETVWSTVNERYFDPTFNGVDWDNVHDEYLPKIAAAQDDETFYYLLNEMCFELGVSHIFVIPADYLEQMDPVLSAPGSVGFDVRMVDDLIVVTDVLPGSPASEAGIQTGFIIVEIDGTPAENVDQLVTFWLPPFNERKYRAQIASAIQSLICGEVSESVSIVYLDSEGQAQEATLTREKRKEQPFIGEGFPTLYAGHEYKRLESGIGYLRFSGFLPQVLDGVLDVIGELYDAPGIIIDIRGNPGGFYPVRKAIASQFFEDSVLLWNYITRTGLDMPGFETEAYTDPPDEPYLGPVVVLVDELCGSSCEEFSGALQANQRAVIIGGRTSGSDLVADVMILPNGAMFFYPIAQTRTADGTVLEGHGVIPDIDVKLDRQQLLQGIDAQLQAAIDFLEEQLEE